MPLTFDDPDSLIAEAESYVTIAFLATLEREQWSLDPLECRAVNTVLGDAMKLLRDAVQKLDRGEWKLTRRQPEADDCEAPVHPARCQQ